MRRLLAALTALALAGAPPSGAVPYRVVGTGQDRCYDDRAEIPPPAPGRAFHGQDAQHPGPAFSYALSADGLTALDQTTGLTWQRSPDTDGNGLLDARDKLTWERLQGRAAELNAARFGGFSDWRLPTIKELYSLFDARGVDPSGPRDGDVSRLRPFLDRTVFAFAYGDEGRGERVIDAQYASCTRGAGAPAGAGGKLFGVNFADGRIKGYDLRMPGGREKAFFALCVRGNPAYGRNDFLDHGDGTVLDRATGLMWAQADSGQAMDWPSALAWVQRKNAERYLGHADWRLPNVKELQSLVDYARSPDATGSPAIDPRFACTPITNEGGQPDFPCYWTGTTHVGLKGAGAAMYVAFGRACGWMPVRSPGPDAGQARFMDVHGAGAQRSDPKTGDPARFPRGRGPQGDVIRIRNLVRLVR